MTAIYANVRARRAQPGVGCVCRDDDILSGLTDACVSLHGSDMFPCNCNRHTNTLTVCDHDQRVRRQQFNSHACARVTARDFRTVFQAPLLESLHRNQLPGVYFPGKLRLGHIIRLCPARGTLATIELSYGNFGAERARQFVRHCRRHFGCRHLRPPQKPRPGCKFSRRAGAG